MKGRLLMFTTLFLILSSEFGLTGCKHRKKITKTKEVIVDNGDTLSGKCRLDFKNSKSLTKHLFENEFKFEWLYLKSKVNSIFEGEDKTFDAKVRVRKDSLMLVTIELLSIDFAKILISTDSIKMVDYYHKKYFVGDYNYINELFNADLDFNVIQSIIIGNSADFINEEEKLKPVTDRENCCYKLSTIRKRKIKRLEQGKEDVKKAVQIMSLNPENFKITENEFYDPVTDRRFVATYSQFEEKDSVYAPYHVNIDIKAQREMHIKIDYVRIEKDKEQKFQFRIPSRYDKIEIEKK